MIITQVHAVDSELTAYAWHRLRLFANPEFTAKQVIRLHQLPVAHHQHALAQAKQIRYCIVQGEEYLNSAAAASIATRPLLLYYGLMSFALAEVLMKGTGDDRLSKLRERNAAHGLTLSLRGSIDPKVPLSNVLLAICSASQFGADGRAFGTFEVWRKQTREVPVPEQTAVTDSHGSVSRGSATSFFGSDVEPPSAPKEGYSLAAAICALPQLRTVLRNLDVEPGTVRARFERHTHRETSDGRQFLVVHPDAPEMHQRFYQEVTLHPAWVNSMDIIELASGVQLSWPVSADAGLLNLPPSIALDSDLLNFVTNGWKLGEFGSYYVALHALGNLVRYFPDLWMPHVERSTEFSLVVQEVCEAATMRLPVLLASELDRRYYIRRK